MKKLILFLMTVGMLSIPSLSSISYSEEDVIVATDEYALTLKLQVPQVLNNMQSLGYRKFQTQTIKGKMLVNWLEKGGFRLSFEDLANNNFSVGGAKARYEGYEDTDMIWSRFNWIGSNKTESFNVPTLCFYLELEPSYAIGGNNEDNSFYLLLAGKGTSSNKKVKGLKLATSFKGNASGTQGCGCYAYGHKSPTRKGTKDGASKTTDDVVSTYGTWSAVWKRRL